MAMVLSRTSFRRSGCIRLNNPDIAAALLAFLGFAPFGQWANVNKRDSSTGARLTERDRGNFALD
jgi:hypothetical protein